MEKLTLSVVIGAAIGAGFKAAFQSANAEVNTLGKTLKDIRAQQKTVQQAIGSQDALTGIGKSLQETQARLAGARDAYAAAQSAHTALTGSVKVGRQEVAQYARTLAASEQPTQAQIQGYMAAKARLAQLESQYSTSANTLRNSRNEVKAAEKATTSLEDKQAKLNTRVGESIAALQKAGVATGDLRAEEVRLGAAMKETTDALAKQKAIENTRSTAKADMQGQIVKLGATIAFLKSATGQAMDFESAMADVRKVVNFDTPEQFKDMATGIKDLSTRLPITAEGIAAIVAAGGQAGFARDELLGFAEDAAKMGVAFDTTAAEAGQMMAQWRTAFKLPQKDVVELADKINYLGNTGPANAQKISEIVTRIGPLGGVAGVASGEIAALGSTVSGMGIGSEMAATGIKNLMLGMNAGASATQSQTRGFDRLGLSATDMAKAMQDDAAGAITMVLEKISELPQEVQAATLDDLFGKESIGAIAPLLTNLDKLRENISKVGDATKFAGSMNKEYELRAATTANNVQEMKNRFSRLASVIGNVFLPPLNLVAGILGTVTNGIASVAEKFPMLTTVVVSAATGWMFYKTAIAAATFAGTYMPGLVGKLSVMMPVLTTVTTLAGTAMAWFGAMLAGTPIGWIIAGIAALVGVGLLVWKYWQPIAAFFGGVWDGFADGLRPLGAIVATVFGPLAPIFSAVGSAIAGAFGWLTRFFAPVDDLSGKFAGAASAGRVLGAILSGAFKLALWPLTLIIRSIGWVIDNAGKIGSFFGFGGGAATSAPGDAMKANGGNGAAGASPRQAAAAAVVAGAVAASPAAAAPGAAQVTQTNSYQIAVHAAPGMDEKGLASEVQKQMAARDRQQASRQRGSLYDRS